MLVFAGLGAGILSLLLAGFWLAYWRLSQGVLALDALLQGALIPVFCGLALVVWAWLLMDRHVARPLDHLAGDLRTGHLSDVDTAPWLGDLAPAIRDAAMARAKSDSALSDAVAALEAELREDQATLEKILADFGAGAVLTDTGGRVVFYNQSAGTLLQGLALDRPLSRYLRAGSLQAASRRLDAGVEATDFFALSGQGGRIAARMRRIGDTTLLILRPDNQEVLAAAQIEPLRRHAATLVPMLDALDGPIPPQLAAAIRAEGRGLAQSLHDMTTAQERDRSAARAMLVEITAGLPALGVLPELWVQAEAGSMNALLIHFDRKLRALGWDPHLRLAGPEPDEVKIVMEWRGEALSANLLEQWLDLPPDPDLPDLTGHAILAAHATGIWPEGRYGQGQLVLPLALAMEDRAQAALTYDFALARRGVASTRLADLSCVVFDTETTGLAPSDRVVQIAGLRIARGRLTGETFETLVNPGRPIPFAASAIHHISDEMVALAPGTDAAFAAFHHFADEAILVAHNAPFDMGFLHAARSETGLTFGNPVLDTVLLSAMIWGASVPHTLDALCARLSIEIPPEHRHSAMGDARATAQAFLRMIPVLQSKGVERLADVSREARRYRSLIKDANLTSA